MAKHNRTFVLDDTAPPASSKRTGAPTSDDQMPLNVDASSDEEDPLQSTAAKIAPCENSPSNVSVSDRANVASVHSTDAVAAETALPTSLKCCSPAKSELDLAIGECKALKGKVDTIVSKEWSAHSGPTLAASLRFMAAYKAASKDERQSVRQTLKNSAGVRREPNLANVALIGIYMCVEQVGVPLTKTQRSHWSRFAAVVNLAASVPISPSAAGEWLVGKTLTGIVADWREKRGPQGKNERKAVKGSPYPNIAKAKKLKDHAEAMNILKEAFDHAEEKLKMLFIREEAQIAPQPQERFA